jgi:hypothetical protein
VPIASDLANCAFEPLAKVVFLDEAAHFVSAASRR